MSSLVPLQRGQRVITTTNFLQSSRSSIKPSEIGVIVQVMRDQQAYRLRREVRSLYAVRGPRGETTTFQPEHIQLAPTNTTPSLPNILNKTTSENNLNRSLLRSWSQGSCCEEDQEEDRDTNDSSTLRSKGGTPAILVRTASYDAVEDNSDCEEEEEMADEDKDDIDTDEWSEVYDKSETTESPPLLRTPSAVDRTLTVAYWRDPIKVAKEYKKYKKLKIDASKIPKTAVLCRLENESQMEIINITSNDILNGKLNTDTYDVLVVPGGYATNYLDAIEDEGELAIQNFVKNGGGFVGICAGAYCGSSWGWNLIDVDVVDIEHWCRGMSQRCFLKYTERGNNIMVDKNEKDKTNVVVRYANGPILAIGNDASSDVQAAANFISDFARKKSSPIGVMVDSPAIVTSDPTDGSGRVILISPHVEDGEPCTKGHFRNLFRWASKKKYDRESTDGDRGKWWRELVRQDRKRYPPRMKDWSYPDGLNQLDQLAKEYKEQTKTTEKKTEKTKRTGETKSGSTGSGSFPKMKTKRINKLLPLTKTTTTSKFTPKPPTNNRKNASIRPQPCYKDGYSMLLSPTSKAAHPFVEFIGGSILLTAPHGLKLAGPRRKHLREKHTTEIVLLLSKAIGKIMGSPASFCVWNYKTARKMDKKNLDPNFLYQSEWSKSPFSTALLKFKSKFRDRRIPCFHVDFHGKNDRKKNKKTHNIDIGIQPFLEHPTEAVGWSLNEVIDLRTVAKEAINANLGKLVIRGKRCCANEDPRLHGWWGDDEDGEECETTMTHQAVLRGIPSLQLETPRSVRNAMLCNKLCDDKQGNEWIEKLALSIVTMYEHAANTERQHGIDQTEENVNKSSEKDAVAGDDAVVVGETKEVYMPSWNDIDTIAADDDDDGISFFVYGSLRPDDINDMPWRESFLKGGKCTRGEILGTMYDDSYASVVLPTLNEKNKARSIVQGWIVKYSEDLSASKLKEGDLIEGYPSLYGRERVTVRVHDGTVQIAWCYVRPDCNKKKKVANGDWLVHCRNKNKKDVAQGSSGQNEQVEEFINSGFKEYRGQNDTYAGVGGVARMIDQMVSDCIALDKFSPDRQV